MSRFDGPEPTPERPEILAPAGDVSCFLAALAAGADNIYLGLKQFSARMQAENFGLTELSKLTDLAHEAGCRVTVAMNTLIKQQELDPAFRLVNRLESQVGCDGLIVQDLAMIDVARQAGYTGSITLSTLANLTHPESLQQAKALGADRVVLPRELSIDEIRQMAEACPDGVVLECFIHGALCYCVSGRCYWSSYMGGKSGLRGRCVQPCRRIYSQGGSSLQGLYHKVQRGESQRQDRGDRGRGRPDKFSRFDRSADRRDERPGRQEGKFRGQAPKFQSGRYFSCQDLSLDVLIKTVTGIPHLVSWKIEGRKKGPHYVYHAVTAYRLLRDNPGDPKARKMAEDILDLALGRPRTRARFLPQRPAVPVDPAGQTSSGLLVGKTGINQQGQPYTKPFIPLLPKDYLRIGIEDENWHTTLPVPKFTPKGGTLLLRIPKHKTPKAGVAVYLIDRREKELTQILADWQARLDLMEARPTQMVHARPRAVQPCQRAKLPDMIVQASLPEGKETRGARKFLSCLWLSAKSAAISHTVMNRFGWWLPPVIWPDEEETFQKLVGQLWRAGARRFTCNAPWQIGFFTAEMRKDPDISLTAGPFCNIANAQACGVLKQMGFTSAVASPELPGADLLALPKASPLPLGIVLSGSWPVGMSRFGTLGVRLNEPFMTPRGEAFWARQYGENTWIYPAWQLNILEHRQELEKAGYSFFVSLKENVPKSLPQLNRPGLFNWENPLL